jgi:alpha-D-ribose 1-methylphosphonate 5-triphosphate diphosphatase
MTEIILRNANIVRAHGVFPGSLRVVDGVIDDLVDDTVSTGFFDHMRTDEDVDGDYLLPGLIEIHTDALEWHLRPRLESIWPANAAVIGHDAVLASAGITTVLDSLTFGDLGGDGFRADTLLSALTAITETQQAGNFRIDHKLHFRCEVADPRTPGLFEEHIDNPLLRLVSLMDHTPGGRQYTDLDGYRRSHMTHGSNSIEVEERIARLIERQSQYSMSNWSRIAKLTCDRDLPLASHDDATLDDVRLAIRSGVSISEFPTTELAARAAKEAGLDTAAGAPNIVRGGSHSGNVAASHLAAERILDIITSDYAPYSLLHAPFVLAQNDILPLHQAASLVTARPAAAVGLHDRGRLEVGMRADIIRVRVANGVPVIRGVWCEGQRVA